MRFSLNWILAGMAYVALAAAAFSERTWVYADLFCIASLAALSFAVLLVFFAGGKRQVAAGGFLVMALGYLLCLAFGGNRAVPAERLLRAAGIERLLPPPISPPVQFPLYSTGTVDSFVDTNAISDSRLYAPSTTADFAACLRAAHAVSVMALGLLGMVLGIVAFRLAKQSNGDDHAGDLS